jgi:hypothetical protein
MIARTIATLGGALPLVKRDDFSPNSGRSHFRAKDGYQRASSQQGS